MQMFRLTLTRAFATRVSRPTRKLLRPYDLALQLKQLSADGKIDAAVQRLRSVPRDAQNVATWNTMLSLCASQKKFQLMYSLFVDMKRRGFSPNVATFVTLLKGLSQISDWSNHPKQLANAHTLYQYYLEHIQSVKHHDLDDSAQLAHSPLVFYISILGATGDIQKMFDVYFAMDRDGPYAPTKYIFTAMLRAIIHHQERAEVLSVRDTAASDAKHVWLQIEKTMQKRSDFKLDSHLVAATIHALARGRPADQTLALDIIASHLGLTRPGDPGPFRFSPLLNHWTLDAALQVCSAMQKWRLCVHFMQLVMDNLDFDRPDARTLLNKVHIHKLLRAHASLALLASPHASSQAIDVLEWCLKQDAMYVLPDLRPDMYSYHHVLVTCCRTGDWENLVRSFQLMTGIQTDSFNESEGRAAFRVQKRSKGRLFTPNVETMSLVLRTALQTKGKTRCLLAFRLSEHVGIDDLLEDDVSTPYHRASFARALENVIDRLLDDPRTEHGRDRLLSFKARAQQVVRTFGHALVRPEKLMVGNQSTMQQEDDAVSFDLAARSSKPRSR